MKYYFVYILASKRNGTLYIGMTNNLTRRMIEHKTKINDGFTKRFNVHKLVYYQVFQSVENAIKREKQLKCWRRIWKLRLIEDFNEEWRDLFEDLK